MSDPLVATGVTKTFRTPDGAEVVAVDDVSLTVPPGSIAAITGPSGSGKTTLLQLLAGLDRADRGTVEIDGVEIGGLGDRRLSELRRRRVGFVFQSYNLIPSLDARANITLPLEIDGRASDGDRLAEITERLGIADRLHHRPGQLSGGQQQRVAVARALLAEPAVVFADEPTGALDRASADTLLDVLLGTARELDQAVVLVTHDPVVAARADLGWSMDAGRLSPAAVPVS